ncbi:MAG TPA: aldo/keto reductase [Ktedonobacterales bacterium]|nr:aldo/keto reductase [Ktedonobacterales bacterium]
MRYRQFGATDLTVSELGFGCARLGGVFQSVPPAEMLNALLRAREQGITFFDTSDMYTQGESEAMLGKAFARRRADVIIASKVGYCLPARRKLISRVKPLLRPVVRRLGITRAHLPSGASGALSQDFSPGYIIQAVERSLRRLRTDYLDLYQLHSPPAAVLESGEFLAPLEKLKRDGKIRYFGVSCETTADAHICLRYPSISSLQLRLSLLDQSALDTIVPRAREHGVALIARECYAGGLLTKPLDALGLESLIPSQSEREAKRDEILSYARLAEQAQRPLSELALQFALGTEGISVTLVGIRTQVQLADNLRHFAAPPLSASQRQAIREQWAVTLPAKG